jgi:hypothetical protein
VKFAFIRQNENGRDMLGSSNVLFAHVKTRKGAKARLKKSVMPAGTYRLYLISNGQWVPVETVYHTRENPHRRKRARKNPRKRAPKLSARLQQAFVRHDLSRRIRAARAKKRGKIAYFPKRNPERKSVCLCEHDSHFGGGSHQFGAKLPTENVKTPYGTYSVCAHCREHHLKKFIIPTKRNPAREITRGIGSRDAAIAARRAIRHRRKYYSRGIHRLGRYFVQVERKGRWITVAQFIMKQGYGGAEAYARALKKLHPKRNVRLAWD